MTQEHKKGSIELDKLDLSSFTKKQSGSEKKKTEKTPPEAREKKPFRPEPKVFASGQKGSAAKAGLNKKKLLAISKKAALILGAVALLYLSYTLVSGIMGRKTEKPHRYISAIEKSSRKLNGSLINLNQIRSSRIESGITDEYLEKVERSILFLSDYNNDTSKFIRFMKTNREKQTGNQAVLQESLKRYRSASHTQYITRFKEGLVLFDKMLKYRMRYHRHILAGESLRRQTYEKYIMDFKLVIKQLRIKYVYLNTLTEETAKRKPALANIKAYYHIPAWSEIDPTLKLLR